MKGKEAGFTLIELVIVVSIIGILLALAGVGTLAGMPSEGDRTGQVNKVSRKGFIWQTWEGQLSMGEAGVNVWGFSIDRTHPHEQEIVAALTKAMKDGVDVRIHYHEPLFWKPWNAGSRTLVESVEPVRTKPAR